MKITILGSGAAYPRPGGGCSGYLIEGGGARVWLDAGNGTLARLQQRVGLREVDALVLSHSHADHTADVLPYMYALGLPEPIARPLPLHAPPDVVPKLTTHVGEGSLEIFSKVFAPESIDGPFEVGGLRFEPFATVHPVETYGFRVSEDGRTFAYTADTALFPELAEACASVDVLLSEATFVGPRVEPPGLHLYAHEAGTLATKAGAGSLLLTHVWAGYDLDDAVEEASSTYAGPVEAVTEDGVYEL